VSRHPSRLGRDEIMKLAGPRTFARGDSYQRRGKVEGVGRCGSTVTATVRGTDTYRVKISFGENPTWGCSCPAGADGAFCKHCAALAIDLLAPEERKPFRATSRGYDLSERVRSLSRAELEEIVRLAALRDPRIRDAIEGLAG
jgi:uncharacterized Zn finger protein